MAGADESPDLNFIHADAVAVIRNEGGNRSSQRSDDPRSNDVFTNYKIRWTHGYCYLLLGDSRTRAAVAQTSSHETDIHRGAHSFYPLTPVKKFRF